MGVLLSGVIIFLIQVGPEFITDFNKESINIEPGEKKLEEQMDSNPNIETQDSEEQEAENLDSGNISSNEAKFHREQSQSSPFNIRKNTSKLEKDESQEPKKNLPIDTRDPSVALKGVIDEIAQNMVEVEGGEFRMGGEGEKDEQPYHEVLLSPFFISKYEVTQKQYEMIMGENPSRLKDCPNCMMCPVESVT